MSKPNLSFNAASANVLLAQLQATDITVPHITEGRTSQHREQYVMARFLATAASAGKIAFPLTLMHGDKPDFVLNLAGLEVGVECVEAVPEDWYEIAALQERLFPESMYFGQTFRPGEQVFERREKLDIASGKKLGYPWVGDMPKQQWITAMVYFIAQKTEKLRAGNYSPHKTMWLLIQDEWRVPIHDPQEIQEAAVECLRRIAHFFEPPCFHSIFICSRSMLLCFENDQLEVQKINDLWCDG